MKVEHLLDDVCVKDEPRPDGVCINREPSSSEVSVKEESASARAAAELYAGHAVKDELVLGTELVERRGTRHASAASNGAIKEQQLSEIVPRGPFLRDCSVRLNRLDMDKLLTHIRSTDRDNESGQTPQKISSGGPETYRCAHCKYTTVQKLRLIRHLSKHTSERPHSCDQCNYTCSFKSRLKIHYRTHTGKSHINAMSAITLVAGKIIC
ncbi:zinc finger protein 84-like isoform X3 [Leguminivora glycinivorella]|uniref:zinc finger protein 84-like isoform X3 n=1 Tax=Leguminivora glycinivorella TaxID=1035111 RepID=UPI002010553F|nr:zinc finger protein 84-like isoform X3 [Leguminivora glycinivorella]